ncbi:2-hydroxychromene-2-carboxylate isomerase [Hoeflea prorocentri]|uniref:2-hydroxychromene-2-carboxylate isomerase n=1 Tax=Hoeflea prorocentri TaxID=1922333 RepID=A0A9X3ZIL9_9HYPH|nr:2-hydroxychromene-2-carboxylate isomerase [Hoeflea prorocentri]MCY6382589.1 2-hydroxychromene-2-carboxylate isomerase [Hoeflea prorocentri]MDA5400389.1 2-hydroxychromene-2-carboxylate isomerase [Hoeflea prorocentri]
MKIIEYFYSAHSAFAYIGSKRLLEICSEHGCRLEHRPIGLSPVVRAAGGKPFAGRTQRHVDYYFGREVERWAQFRGVPIINFRPTFHDNPLDLPNGMLIAAIDQGADVDTLSHAILEAHWQDDADLADPEALAKAASAAGIDPAPLLDAALTEPIQAMHQANTDEAIARGLFGSPTYFVDGDMFYGQDHLELMERALKKPFAPASFKNPRTKLSTG